MPIEYKQIPFYTFKNIWEEKMHKKLSLILMPHAKRDEVTWQLLAVVLKFFFHFSFCFIFYFWAIILVGVVFCSRQQTKPKNRY
jgi:hypothetical protein